MGPAHYPAVVFACDSSSCNKFFFAPRKVLKAEGVLHNYVATLAPQKSCTASISFSRRMCLFYRMYSWSKMSQHLCSDTSAFTTAAGPVSFWVPPWGRAALALAVPLLDMLNHNSTSNVNCIKDNESQSSGAVALRDIQLADVSACTSYRGCTPLSNLAVCHNYFEIIICDILLW